ncbi:NERD nuclease [Serinibacter arcticus]|uniref:NERD nuclease n=1 Tax=Serinibacter arcticus TaxID=1655435 RepID=A0A2U1ZR07_9MICO|nr:nuclease-related domain-containing protein [Serinibacter arcticus]PWD49380.1 NERD nuclease [Serinibacter arcticus]
MPHLFPADPPDDSRDHGAERAVWTAVRDALPDDALLIANLRLQEGAEQREADLVVVWPPHGIAVIEVKGGAVRRVDGEWRQGPGEGRTVDPGYQADRAKHSLRRYLRTHAPSLGDVRFAHLVALPHTRVPADVRPPDLPRPMLIDAATLEAGDVGTQVRSSLGRHAVGHADLDDVGTGLVHATLADSFPGQSEQLALAEAHDLRLERMTREQERVLDLIDAFPSAQVVGGAGSGKTYLALAQARRLARRHRRVALLCYSRGLGRYMERTTATWPARERPAWVGLFHDLPVALGADPGRDDVAEDWEVRLPADLARLAGTAEPFDAIVVDEAQDFSEAWWPALTRCLRGAAEGGSAGGLFVFSDEAQRIFPREGRAPVELPPFRLSENLRSTRQIAQVFGSLTDTDVSPQGMSGPAVRLVEAGDAEALGSADPSVRAGSADAVVDAADSVVEALLEEGWDPGHVALLVTGRRHPAQVSDVGHGGFDAYWDTFFAEEDVFYGHVLGFKGLERRVVVLAVNGVREVERARHILYAGMSRARTLLVLVGPRAYLERVGGEGLANRLRKADRWSPA